MDEKEKIKIKTKMGGKKRGKYYILNECIMRNIVPVPKTGDVIPLKHSCKDVYDENEYIANEIIICHLKKVKTPST